MTTVLVKENTWPRRVLGMKNINNIRFVGLGSLHNDDDGIRFQLNNVITRVCATVTWSCKKFKFTLTDKKQSMQQDLIKEKESIYTVVG